MPHVINSRALIGEKPCINKAIHALLMHGYATFNMLVPGTQNCCRHEMCTALPQNEQWKVKDLSYMYTIFYGLLNVYYKPSISFDKQAWSALSICCVLSVHQAFCDSQYLYHILTINISSFKPFIPESKVGSVSDFGQVQSCKWGRDRKQNDKHCRPWWGGP